MWHLMVENLKGRKAYNAIILSAVTLAVITVLFTIFMTNGVQKRLEDNRRQLGPDLAVVPAGTKEKGHIYLTKGPPAQGVVPPGTAEQMKRFPEIEAVTVQKDLGSAMLGDNKIKLIGFEPKTDFVIQAWLSKKSPNILYNQKNEALLGAKVETAKVPGDTFELAGRIFTVSGRLQETGASMDTAVFLPLPDGQIMEPSWILLRLAPGVSLDIMTNKLETNITNVEVIARPEMLKTINDQLYALLQGGGFGAAALLVVIGALLIIGTMFALMIHERRREFGLLKAMGARNSFVFRLILWEAVVLGGAGGGLGVLFAAAALALAAIGVIPVELSSLPDIGFVLFWMLLSIAASISVGVLTALYPALIAARLEPYAAIRSGE